MFNSFLVMHIKSMIDEACAYIILVYFQGIWSLVLWTEYGERKSLNIEKTNSQKDGIKTGVKNESRRAVP